MADPNLKKALALDARASGCVVEDSFNQIKDVNEANVDWLVGHPNEGICAGLAPIWLDLLCRGEGDTFRARITAPNDNTLRDKAHDWWLKSNDDAKPWLSAQGEQEGGQMVPGVMVDSEKKPRPFDLKKCREQPADEHEHYRIESDEMDLLVDWVNKTSMGKRRFFLMVNAKHSMAIAKNRKGRIRFYDPNGGVAGTWFASNMKTFLRLYLSRQVVHDNYKANTRSPSTLTFTLQKYRPRDW